MILLIDLDGTICDCAHRAYLLDGFEDGVPLEAWEEYFNRHLMMKDEPIERSLKVLNLLYERGAELIYLTARMERTTLGNLDIESITREWLELHNYPDVELRMRPHKMRGSSLEVKRKMTEDLHNITDVMLIDDKLSVHELALENNWIWCKAPECWETLEEIL